MCLLSLCQTLGSLNKNSQPSYEVRSLSFLLPTESKSERWDHSQPEKTPAGKTQSELALHHHRVTGAGALPSSEGKVWGL